MRKCPKLPPCPLCVTFYGFSGISLTLCRENASAWLVRGHFSKKCNTCFANSPKEKDWSYGWKNILFALCPGFSAVVLWLPAFPVDGSPPSAVAAL